MSEANDRTFAAERALASRMPMGSGGAAIAYMEVLS
jgi:hypothetical protein